LKATGHWVAVFEQFLNSHLDDFLVMFECFFLGIAPCGRAISEQGRTMGRPPILIRLDHYLEDADLQAFPLDR
jgi:hypothetical protein